VWCGVGCVVGGGGVDFLNTLHGRGLATSPHLETRLTYVNEDYLQRLRNEIEDMLKPGIFHRCDMFRINTVMNVVVIPLQDQEPNIR
jgi:hypothetical protein